MRLAAFISILFAMSACVPGNAQVQSPSPRAAELPRDLLDDLRAYPSRENGLWLLGGAALTLIVCQIEDPEGAARTWRLVPARKGLALVRGF